MVFPSIFSWGGLVSCKQCECVIVIVCIKHPQQGWFQQCQPLLETGPSPSANWFAECQKSDTRQRLGKELHSAKNSLPRQSHVEMSWFVSIVRDNVHEIFWNFYYSLHIRYHDLSTSFMIFRLRLLFIEFKNTSHASSWSYFVNKMSEILGPFLDTASRYTQ